MSTVFKISEAAILALHATVLLAVNADKKLTTNEIATKLNVSEAHLSKVLQRLTRVGLVKSIRGPKGGFILGKSSNNIMLLEIYEAIEGPLKTPSCLLDKPVCEGNCILGELLSNVDLQVRRYMEGKSLSEMAKRLGKSKLNSDKEK